METVAPSAVSLVRRLHQHRAWVNENLLAAADKLSEEQLRQTFAIGQGSVWNSLVHMFAAEYHWLEALKGNENPLFPGDVRGKLPGNQMGEGGLTSFAELCEQWRKHEESWKEYLAALQAESLDDLVYKIVASDPSGQRMATRRADILLHLCLHSQYTAAQVVNMFRQLGVDKLPQTMLIALARMEAAASG